MKTKINPIVSLITVHYHCQKELVQLLKSIPKSCSKHKYEVIIIDNDLKQPFDHHKNPTTHNIRYIKNSSNTGFGSANNLGAKSARGKYLFFINPDTILDPHSLDKLIDYLENHPKTLATSPFILDHTGQPHPLQGSSSLTPMKAIFSLSIFHKLLPNNPYYKKYWLPNCDRSKPFLVEVLPGTAILIRSSIFHQIGGFDPNIFLYFEESDLCFRLLQHTQGQLIINPHAKITHIWEVSTKNIPQPSRQEILNRSRAYYFHKHYGRVITILTELILRINKYSLATIILLCLIFIYFTLIRS